MLFAAPAAAQRRTDCSWCEAVDGIVDTLNGAFAEGLAMIAIVVAGLLWAFDVQGAKQRFAAIIFGCGMMLAADDLVRAIFGP